MNRFISSFGPTLLVLVLAQTQTPVLAQLEPGTRAAALSEAQNKAALEEQLPVLMNAPSEQQTRAIRVRNVRLDTMAHWLDPSYIELPVAFQTPLPDRAIVTPAGATIQPGRTLAKMTKGLIPAGISSIVAIAPQNVFIAYGTRRALDELENTVTLLDKPLRKIAVEMQVVQAENADLESLGANPRDAAMQNAQLETGLVAARSNWNQLLDTLVKAGKAKVVTSSRVLTSSNMSAGLKRTQSHETTLQLKSPQQGAALAKTLQNLPAPLSVVEGTRFEVTPSVSGNDLITVVLDVKRVLALTVGSEPEVPLSTSGAVKTTFNMRDGDTMILRGLKAGAFDANSSQPDAPVAVLLKAAIVRNADEWK